MPQYSRWSSFRRSFQFKLFLIFSLSTFFISCLLSTLYVVSEIKESRRQAEELLHLRTQQLAVSVRLPLYAENRDALRTLAEQSVAIPEIREVKVSTPDGRVLTDLQFAGTIPGAISSPDVISQTVEVRSNNQLDSIESSLSGSRDASATLLGTVRMVQGTAGLARTIRHTIAFSACIATVFWLITSMFCYQVLQRFSRSFVALVDGINSMQSGDFTTQIVIDSDDEPGRAAHAVNRLASALHQRGEENNRLQEERLNLERQMLHGQKLESLGLMAGGIAHDFNNLLQAMLGNMELASMHLFSDSMSQKYLEHAMHSAKRAALLASLMLTYVGKGLISKNKLDLNELVRENTEILKIAASKTVSIELNLSADLPAILADEASIQQVVMNLITNAAESIQIQPGYIRMTTGIQCCDAVCLATSLIMEKPEPGRYVFLEVADNGCGMNSETLKRLFDPFFSTKFTGRGLGMSAVMGIIKTHCGALFVTSEPDKGTTFRALFPVLEGDFPPVSLRETGKGEGNLSAVGKISTHLRSSIVPEGEMTEISLEQVLSPEDTPSSTVLVVDDEKSVLRICTKMVQLCGFTAITACDGLDAVAKFREHDDEIAVVLMDLTMPNMDGITAMTEIYRINPKARVILSSGFNEDELSERIASQPPAGFIRKPYSMRVLEAEIQRVVQMV